MCVAIQAPQATNGLRFLTVHREMSSAKSSSTDWIDMRPPGESKDRDTGYTHRNVDDQNEQRLDYICRLRSPKGPRLVAHQMRIGHRTVSDHYAVQALIQFEAEHCQPRSAVDIDAIGPLPSPAGKAWLSKLYIVPVTIPSEAGRFWIWVPREGTYSFLHDPKLEHETFFAHDLSRPILHSGELHVGDLSGPLQALYLQLERTIQPAGRTYVARAPMLISIRSHTGIPTSGTFTVLEHRGESPATAIGLPAYHKTTVPFPAGEPLGDSDTAWFRVQPTTTLMAKPRAQSVTVEFGSGGGKMNILNFALASRAMKSGVGTVTHAYSISAADEFYVTVTRGAQSEVGQTILWETPVTFLRLDKPFIVHVADETSVDWAGADEPELEFYIDDELLTKTSWDDADTGEDWPGIVDTIRFDLVKRGWKSDAVAFSGALDVVVNERDIPPTAHGISSTPINGLHPQEDPEKKRVVAVGVFDAVSNGTYTVSCVLARDP